RRRRRVERFQGARYRGPARRRRVGFSADPGIFHRERGVHDCGESRGRDSAKRVAQALRPAAYGAGLPACREVLMAITVPDLLKMTQKELDDLFTKSDPGPIPDGPAEGTAIIAPGTTYSPEIAKLINLFAWQGKTFDGPHGVLRNRILPLHLNAI